jgi:hypothetical protein
VDDEEYQDVLKRIRVSDSDIEEISDSANRPECHICHKNFARKYNLDRHMMTHNEDRASVCDICKFHYFR